MNRSFNNPFCLLKVPVRAYWRCRLGRVEFVRQHIRAWPGCGGKPPIMGALAAVASLH
jgi:hypothetical protein